MNSDSQCAVRHLSLWLQSTNPVRLMYVGALMIAAVRNIKYYYSYSKETSYNQQINKSDSNRLHYGSCLSVRPSVLVAVLALNLKAKCVDNAVPIFSVKRRQKLPANGAYLAFCVFNCGRVGRRLGPLLTRCSVVSAQFKLWRLWLAHWEKQGFSPSYELANNRLSAF